MSVVHRVRMVEHMKAVINSVKTKDWVERARAFVSDLEESIMHLSDDMFYALVSIWDEQFMSGIDMAVVQEN